MTTRPSTSTTAPPRCRPRLGRRRQLHVRSLDHRLGHRPAHRHRDRQRELHRRRRQQPSTAPTPTTANYFGATATIDVEKAGVGRRRRRPSGRRQRRPGQTLLDGFDAPGVQVRRHQHRQRRPERRQPDRDDPAFDFDDCATPVPTTLARRHQLHDAIARDRLGHRPAHRHRDRQRELHRRRRQQPSTAPTPTTPTTSARPPPSTSRSWCRSTAAPGTFPTPTRDRADPARWLRRPGLKFVVTNTGNVALSGVSLDRDDPAFDFDDCATPVPTTPRGRRQLHVRPLTSPGPRPAHRHRDRQRELHRRRRQQPSTAPTPTTANYFGAIATIDVEKLVSVDGGAGAPSGRRHARPASPARWLRRPGQFKFVVTNTGNVALSGVSLTDDDPAFDFDDCATPVPTDPEPPAPATRCNRSTIAWASRPAHRHRDRQRELHRRRRQHRQPLRHRRRQLLRRRPRTLHLSKSASPATYNTVGQAITYTYTVKNSGNVTLTGPFMVSDNRIGSPAGTPFACGSGALVPNQTLTCSATYTITQADIDAGSVTNTASVSASYSKLARQLRNRHVRRGDGDRQRRLGSTSALTHSASKSTTEISNQLVADSDAAQRPEHHRRHQPRPVLLSPVGNKPVLDHDFVVVRARLDRQVPGTDGRR